MTAAASMRRVLAAATGLALLALMLAWLWKVPAPVEGLLITLGPVGTHGLTPAGDGEGTAIARVDIGAVSRPPRLLIDGFAAAGTPRGSYDGRRAVFAGRRSAADPMQVWEVSLAGSSPRMIVGSGECLDPAYLPDGRIVYARSLPGADAPTALHVALGDGREERRITFGDARDRAPAVLLDGRIAFRRQPRQGSDRGRLFVINPDGTGLQMFAEAADGASIEGGPWVIDDHVVFAEHPLQGAGPRLVSVSFRQPLGERVILTDSEAPVGSAVERFSSIGQLPDGGLVAAAYVKENGWTLRPIRQDGVAPHPAVSLPAFDRSLRPAGVALAAPRTRPLSLTSVVDERKQTGTLLCLDVRASRIPAVAGARAGSIRTVRVLAADGSPLGDAPVEADGSFFVEVPADRPLRLELLGPDGAVASDHSGFWVRPNENRGCIGCHEDPELAPENRVVLAVARAASPLGTTTAMARSEAASK